MHECGNAHACVTAFLQSCNPAILQFPVMSDIPHRVPIEGEIDLHAFAPANIVSVVNEYIEAAADAGLEEVRLVHGRGRGIQRAAVQAALERHRLVVEFWDDPASHLGATFARLAPSLPSA